MILRLDLDRGDVSGQVWIYKKALLRGAAGSAAAGAISKETRN